MVEIYDAGREFFSQGKGSWNGSDIVAAVVSPLYQFDITHRYTSDIPSGAILAEKPVDPALRTGADGFLDADGILFDNFTTSDVAHGVVIYDATTTALLLWSDGSMPFDVYPTSQLYLRVDLLQRGFGRI